VKSSKNDENFEFVLISCFKNFKKWSKLRKKTKTSRNSDAFRNPLKIAKTSRNHQNFKK